MTNAHDLTLRLIELLRREHGALAEFLLALADFDRRRLWVERGHASLFSFLHRELLTLEGRRLLPEDRGGAHPAGPRRGRAAPRWPALFHERGRAFEGALARERGRGLASVLPSLEAGGEGGVGRASARRGRAAPGRGDRAAGSGAGRSRRSDRRSDGRARSA